MIDIEQKNSRGDLANTAENHVHIQSIVLKNLKLSGEDSLSSELKILIDFLARQAAQEHNSSDETNGG